MSVDNWVSIGIAFGSVVGTGFIAFRIWFHFSAEGINKRNAQLMEKSRKHNEEKKKRKQDEQTV